MRLIQITDCHLGADPSERLIGLETDQTLRDVLSLIREKESTVDHLLCSGDVASKPSMAAYERFWSILTEYNHTSISWLPGNHDDPALMSAASRAFKASSVVETGAWVILHLDSSVPGHTYGELAESQLTFLREQLDLYRDKHVFVSLHHQLQPVGSAWMDAYIVRNAEATLALLASYPSVKVVTWGHVHQAFASHHAHIGLFAAPSTCIQFAPYSHDFKVSDDMPGYRWFELADDGTFSTGVNRVEGKHYTIDFDSIGY